MGKTSSQTTLGTRRSRSYYCLDCGLLGKYRCVDGERSRSRSKISMDAQGGKIRIRLSCWITRIKSRTVSATVSCRCPNKYDSDLNLLTRTDQRGRAATTDGSTAKDIQLRQRRSPINRFHFTVKKLSVVVVSSPIARCSRTRPKKIPLQGPLVAAVANEHNERTRSYCTE
jgi:hypothetical protein